MRGGKYAAVVTAAVAIPLQAFAQPERAAPAGTPSSIGDVMLIIEERNKQYLQRFEAQEKSTTIALAAAERAVQAALIAAKEAVQKAEGAAEKRFDSVNEFRNTLKDQQATFATRVEVNAKLNDIDRRLAEISDQQNRSRGESKGAGDLWGWIVGAVGILFAALTSITNFRRSKPVP